jgi:hypothetical protein
MRGQHLTPSYDFNLATASARATTTRPTSATPSAHAHVAGRDDELFDATKYAAVFAAAGRPVPVTLVDGTGHMGLTLDAAAVQAVARACVE